MHSHTPNLPLASVARLYFDSLQHAVATSIVCSLLAQLPQWCQFDTYVLWSSVNFVWLLATEWQHAGDTASPALCSPRPHLHPTPP